MARNSYSIGILLIAVAVVLLLGKLGVFHFIASFFWPLVLLIPGLLFHFLFFNRTLPAGVLVPGGILTTYALMFFYCNIFGWSSMSYLWPGFILGVAVGLYELHLFDHNSDRGVLIGAMVLGIIAAVFFGMTLLFKLGIYVIALLLVLAGVVLIFRRPRSW
ncbi:LiaI-LiaF-like domain-containing protein [Paenibacillus sp. GCM10027628]|uniref:LiaF transmembrane domain-containing protein n=1 Tax=Paenibacillus sp. GCM10027628 TaxID=3273413 RepID=UPI0036320A7A